MAVTTKKCSMLERYIRSCRVRIEIKHRYRVLSQNKISVPIRVGVISTRALIHTHRTRTNILFCDKTRVPMFYFSILKRSLDLQLCKKKETKSVSFIP